MKRKVVNKLFAVALSAAMVLGLAACGGGTEESSSSNSASGSTPASSGSDVASGSGAESSSTEPEKRTFSFEKITVRLPGSNGNTYGGGNPAYDRLIDDINARIFGEDSTTKSEWEIIEQSDNTETGAEGYYSITNKDLTVPANLPDVSRWDGLPSTNAAFINAATGAGQVVVDTPAVYKKDAEGNDTTEIETPAVTHIEAAGTEVFWDLAPYIELKNADGSYVYPNLAAWKDVQKLALNYYGKIYGIPLSRPNMARTGIGYRQDLALEANIDVTPGEPLTLETFEDLMEALTDPDAGRYGLFLDAWTGALDAMQLWFGVPNRYGIAQDDSYAKYNIKKGDLVPAELTEEYKTALKKFREWYQNGWINPDAFEKDADKKDKVPAGSGLTSTTYGMRSGAGGIHVQVLDQLNSKIEQYFENPDVTDKPVSAEKNVALEDAPFTLCGYVDTGLGGKCIPQSNGMNGFVAISKLGNIKTEEQLKDALYFLDQCSEGWFFDLFTYGWKGEEGKAGQEATYYIDSRGYVDKFDGKSERFADTVTELTAAEAYGAEIGGTWGQGFNQIHTFNYAEGHEPQVPVAPNENPTAQLRDELYAEDIQYLVSDESVGCISDTYTTDGATLNTMINNARISFITEAGYTEDNLDAAIQAWLDAGEQKVIDELNEQYHAMH